MIFLEQINQMTCQSPDCKHLDHDGGLFLNARCHTGAGVLIFNRGDHLDILCAICRDDIAQIAIEHSDAPISIKCSHSPPAHFQVYYINGEITVSCRQCHKFIASFKMRASS
jgi:hypothetical protein